ncbi:hypothetical protein Hanom_Chr01g00063401 [Helianthus anomalus]
MSGLGKICTCLRTWSSTELRGDVGLRLRTFRSLACFRFLSYEFNFSVCTRCDIAFYKFSHIPGLCAYIFFEKLTSWVWFLELKVSLEATSLSPAIVVRLAYILPSPDPINSFAIRGIILGMVVVGCWYYYKFKIKIYNSWKKN